MFKTQDRITSFDVMLAGGRALAVESSGPDWWIIFLVDIDGGIQENVGCFGNKTVDEAMIHVENMAQAIEKDGKS